MILKEGAMAGGLSSILVMAWIVVGAQVAIAKKQLLYPWLPTRVDGCPNNVTDILDDKYMTWTNSVLEDAVDPDATFILYRLSYYYYTLIGAVLVVVVGTVVSALTGPSDPNSLDRNLLSPAIHGFLAKLTKEVSPMPLRAWQKPRKQQGRASNSWTPEHPVRPASLRNGGTPPPVTSPEVLRA